MMRNQMVVRLAGGEILKGFSHDFAPNKPVFRRRGDLLRPRLRLRQNDRLTSPPGEQEPLSPPAGARPVRVKFQWGEEVEGLTYGYDPKRPGFFLYLTAPLDRVHNLERMFIGRGAVEEVKLL